MTRALPQEYKIGMLNWYGRVKYLADKYKVPYDRARRPNSAATLRRIHEMKPEARRYMLKLIREGRH